MCSGLVSMLQFNHWLSSIFLAFWVARANLHYSLCLIHLIKNYYISVSNCGPLFCQVVQEEKTRYIFIFKCFNSLTQKWQPTPVFLPGKSHEWRSLAGYSPWGHKESDTTEQLHFTMGPDAMIFVFWMLSFEPAFSLSSFTFIKRPFSSFSLSAIRVVSSTYLRLLNWYFSW